ncbi:MAG: glycoside hydrolase family 92 protein [Bacteroidetes bacterium]|nr:glycoside hydrolase family 92 protein [Bacteroidota bacterium]
MKKILIICGFALLFGTVACVKQDKKIIKEELLGYVNPNIGAVHARWFFYTPASLPFGMAKLAPHTNAYGSIGSWLPGGYDNRHTSIEGFGHFHEFQIGGVVVMPITGEVKTLPGTDENPDEGYRSRFEKKDETAIPGYYSVFLKDYGVKVELTATERVGFHRYTFPSSDSSALLFDIGHRQGESSEVTDTKVKYNEDNTIEGYVITYPEYTKFCDPGNRVKMFFFAKLGKSPNSVDTFRDSITFKNEKEISGIGTGMILNFQTQENEQIEFQVGLSYTSIENAKLNFDKESKGQDFDKVRMEAHQTWNEKLSKIRVEGGTKEDRIKFYTGLYHALLGRGLASDVNGAYPKHDGSIGYLPIEEEGEPSYHHYNTDGIWGGFWNLTQVWAMAYPEYFSEYLQSNIDFYKEKGWLHDGVAAGNYTNGVQTNFNGLTIASAYNWGIRDFDVKTGYEAAWKNETAYEERDFGAGRYDMEPFVKTGIIPFEERIMSNGWVFNFGVSHTLEYCFGSYAVAQLAKGMGKMEDHKLLMKQATYWKNIFDDETKFIRPKYKNGEFISPFDPMKAWAGYQEGNAYQYTWYVPHDIAGLMESLGTDTFNTRLETMFSDAQKSLFGGGEEIHSFAGIEKLYNHGNQPCLFNSFLFNYSGKPWLTQHWTRTICQEFYGTSDIHGYGYGQDEDQGQLGAWYVLASIGLFDVQGGARAKPTIQLGSPLFDRITISLSKQYYEGEEFVIETTNNTPDNKYIQTARLNGESLENCWFLHSDLTKGGKLELEMGAEPNEQWGVSTPPPSFD